MAGAGDQRRRCGRADPAVGWHSGDVLLLRTLLVLVAVTVSALIGAAPAAAHQPVTLTSADASPARGPLLVDGTVSYAVTAEVTKGERRGFRFALDDGDRFAMQLLIPDEAPGNRLADRQLPRVTVIDPRGRKTRLIAKERTEFYEPYGGRSYLYLSRVEREAVAGTYRVTVTGRSSTPVVAVVAVGYREVPGDVRR